MVDQDNQQDQTNLSSFGEPFYEQLDYMPSAGRHMSDGDGGDDDAAEKDDE
jgi:hypothetical protein